MSTKVYEGILIDQQYDFWEIVHGIRETCENVFKELNIAYTIESLYDEYTQYIVQCYKNSDYQLDAGLFTTAFHKHKEDTLTKPLGCSVYLYPPLDNGRTLGYVQSSSPQHYETLIKLPYISDYAYWNNTDKPDSISGSEWAQRKDDWNTLFPSVGSVFSGLGVSVSLLNAKDETFCLPHTEFWETVQRTDIEQQTKKTNVALIIDQLDLPRWEIGRFLEKLFDIRQLVSDMALDDLPVSMIPELSKEMMTDKRPALPEIDEEKLAYCTNKIMEEK